MDSRFEEFCNRNVCETCQFNHCASQGDCERNFLFPIGDISRLKTIEDKLDRILEHLNIE